MNTLAHLLVHLSEVSDTDRGAPPLGEFAGQLARAGATLLLGVRPHSHRFPDDAAATCLRPGVNGCGLYAWLEFGPPGLPEAVASTPPEPILIFKVAA